MLFFDDTDKNDNLVILETSKRISEASLRTGICRPSFYSLTQRLDSYEDIEISSEMELVSIIPTNLKYVILVTQKYKFHTCTLSLTNFPNLTIALESGCCVL